MNTTVKILEDKYLITIKYEGSTSQEIKNLLSHIFRKYDLHTNSTIFTPIGTEVVENSRLHKIYVDRSIEESTSKYLDLKNLIKSLREYGFNPELVP